MSDAKSAEFRPLTQRERNSLFGKSFINPIWYAKGAISAGQNQWSDVPEPWEQGASGYGKRFGDIMGQYAIRRTAMYGFESWFHEDNRYFPSSKKGFWARTGYALSSGVMGRHDNGKRYPSASILIGYASGAYLSRFWQPSPNRSVGDAAVSFGVSMGWNIGLGVLKEYLPDMLRPLTRKSPAAPASPASPPTKRRRTVESPLKPSSVLLMQSRIPMDCDDHPFFACSRAKRPRSRRNFRPLSATANCGMLGLLTLAWNSNFGAPVSHDRSRLHVDGPHTGPAGVMYNSSRPSFRHTGAKPPPLEI